MGTLLALTADPLPAQQDKIQTVSLRPEGQREQLQKEDLRSIRLWFDKADPSPASFYVAAKQSVDATYSIMIVRADRPGGRSHTGVFAVYGRTNQVYMVLGMDRNRWPCCGTVLDHPSGEAVYVHWLSDYGFYQGTDKYVWDLRRRTPARRFSYTRFSVTRVRSTSTGLKFNGSYDPGPSPVPHKAPGIAMQLSGGRWSLIKVPDAQAQPERSVRSGRLLLELTGSPAESGRTRPAGIRVSRSGSRSRFFPVPLRDLANNNALGAFAFDGNRLWFANDFYDGEGMTGVGALGVFDLATGKYTMHYFPEIARWSGSALLLDGDDVWIGLMSRPEGALNGGGVLRFNKVSGAVTVYPVPALVTGIARQQNLLCFASEHGVYILDFTTGGWTHVTVEPSAERSQNIVETCLPGLLR